MTYGNAWDGTIRDTTVTFPTNTSLTFEKIIMRYNIRCRDGQVNTGGGNSNACGEWDYSCNTYVHDSTRIDSIARITPSHTISGFSGATYDYTTQPVYNYLSTDQVTSVVNTINSENSYVIGNNTSPISNVIDGSKNHSKSQLLLTATELSGAGVTAGDIDAIELLVNTAGDANFFRVKMQHTNLSALDPSSPITTGFSEVYYANTSFVNGLNKLQLNTPFTWDGSSNILVEFSFTNSTSGSTVELAGYTPTDDSTVLFENTNRYATFNQNSIINIPTSSTDLVSDEITISFWINGDENVLPTNTNFVEASNASGSREVNIHMPWGNGRVYWDCGTVGGSGYDRIEKVVNISEYTGGWSHWAFTKNANTGQMNIYRNGQLWHSGTGKTNLIDMEEMFLGAGINNNNFWAGDIDEFRMFSSELDQNTIMEWMNRKIDPSHPFYADLVLNLRFDDPTGTTFTDHSSLGVDATSDNSILTNYQRGDQVVRFFDVQHDRPQVTIYQGDYDLSNTTVTVLDSVEKIQNVVIEHDIASNAGTLNSDDIIDVNTWNYWLADEHTVYDEQGNVINTIPVSSEGTINITDLDYFDRYPSRLQLMSLVTPYGIGLNLGQSGETWYFDITEFTPVLKGDKRITVENGGQWQEDMDIKFLFIVGTPPRDVIDIREVWRNGSSGYQNIIADNSFEPRDFNFDAGGSQFIMKSVITGHGQEGEFIPRTHYVNVNGGTKENEWDVWTECSENPLYPQGGSWIYDRAGWCPGMPSDVQLTDLTNYVTAGQSHEIDYGVNNASGTSNYLVSNQIITYGSPNFTNDVSLKNIKRPSNYIEYKRDNPICANPIVEITNTGSDTLTSATITYYVNDVNNAFTFEWEGALGFMESTEVELPNPSGLWDAVTGVNGNVFYASVSNPNGVTDEYELNNSKNAEVEIPDVFPRDIYMRFQTNSAASETRYELLDMYGNVLYERDNMQNNTLYLDTFDLNIGCYQFRLIDSDDDGISFFANNDGSGYCQIREVGGSLLKNLDRDFGGSLVVNFTVEYPLSYEELTKEENLFELFPNPASDEVIISGLNDGENEIVITDMTGAIVRQVSSTTQKEYMLDVSRLTPGMYYVSIVSNGERHTKKLVVQ
tara:strand:+ start:56051 stop:59410 length:3360 start_codon:yes stop_codon:yes gene_type:complete